MKTRPSATVSTSALNAVFWSSSLTAWCAQVTVAPESSRIRVLRNGMPQVGTGSMPSGGQEVAIGHRRVERTPEERPEEGEEEEHLGGDEQRHAEAQALGDDVAVGAAGGLPEDVAPPAEHDVEHAQEAQERDPAARSATPCIHITPPPVSSSADRLPTSGQGLGSTRW